jgi:hypothetical protein
MLKLTQQAKQVDCVSQYYALSISDQGFKLAWDGLDINFGWDFHLLGTPHLESTPDFSRLWGPGKRIVWKVQWADGLNGVLYLCTYHGRREIIIGGEITPPDEPTAIKKLPLFTWHAMPEDIPKYRIFVNSGDQGYSGSMGLDEHLEDIPYSQDVTALVDHHHTLTLGNVSFQRTNVVFQRKSLPNGGVSICGFLPYGEMLLSPDRKLSLESILLLPETDSLRSLETYADRVVDVLQPRINRSSIGLYNQWYANWTPTSDHGSADLAIQGAESLKRSPLYQYGITTLGSGVWHNRAAFGEEEPWPGLFPEGIRALRDRLHSMGIEFMHGGFWAKASECSTLYREHPDWMAKDDRGAPAVIDDQSWGACPYPYYIPDITLPEVKRWLRNQWEGIQRASTGVYWLDFYGTGTGINLDNELPKAIQFSDRTISYPFETDRQYTQLIRDVVGEDARIAVYTSPTFNLIGLIDRARIAMDCGPIDPPVKEELPGITNLMSSDHADRRWNHLKSVARNIAAAYFYHNRFWINDPDPAMVGIEDRPETIEEARVRLMIVVNSGGPITVGEDLDKIHLNRLDLLKKILPPYGIAARPLDMLQEECAQIFDLFVQTSWDNWHVLTLINWEEQPKRYNLPLSKIGVGGFQEVFEFWNQRYLGLKDDKLEVTIPPRSCRVFCIRPQRSTPWLLSTDLHVTQGGIELDQVAWKPQDRILGGIVYRHDGKGMLTIRVPDGYVPKEIEMNGIMEDSPSAASGVLRVPIDFDNQEIRWGVRFNAI